MMNNYDKDHIIHNDDMVIVNYSKKKKKQNKMEAMVCPNEHIAKSLLWKRAYKTILSHKWVGLFLWPASIDGNCPEGNHKHRVCRQQPLECMAAAAVRSWTTKAGDFHGQLMARCFIFPHYLSISRICTILLFSQLVYSVYIPNCTQRSCLCNFTSFKALCSLSVDSLW